MIPRIFLIILSLYSGLIFAQEKNTYNELFFQTETPLRSHFVGFPIQKKISVSGGLSPYIYQIKDSHLPEGIKLTEDGFLSGIAQKIISATFSVRVNDHKGKTVQKEFTIDFVEQLMMKTEALDNAIAGTMYSQQIFATGGSKGDYKWEIVSNNTPEGMQLDSQSGIFSGIPQKSGKYMITVVVQDTDAHTSTKRFPFRIIEPLQIKSLVMPSGLVGEEYSELIQISGGVGPYTFSFSDNLPEGLTLDPVTGIIEGLPSYADEYVVLVNVQDNYLATPQHVEEKVRIVINEEFSFTTNSVLPDALQNEYLSDDFVISIVGGKGLYTFEIIDGTLPEGVDIHADQGIKLIRTPYESGDFTFTLQATDQEGKLACKQFFWSVISELKIDIRSIPSCTVNTSYQVKLLASGGVPPYIWSSNLPNGLEIVNRNNDWFIEGVVKKYDGDPFIKIWVQVHDSNPIIPQSKEKLYPFDVLKNDLVITTDTIQEGTIGAAYKTVIEAGLGIEPYRWSLISGSLPQGLSWSVIYQDVCIQGSPEVSGYFPFCFEVFDASEYSAPVSKCLTLVVHDNISQKNGKRFLINENSSQYHTVRFSSALSSSQLTSVNHDKNIGDTNLLELFNRNLIHDQPLKKQTIYKKTEYIDDMMADNHKIYGIISQCGSNTLITNVSISTENVGILTSTNCQGEFEIRNLSPGKYDLIFSTNNFLNKNVSVDVNSNHDYYIDVCMCSDIDINFSTETLLPSAIIGKQYWNSIDVNGGCQPYTFSYEGNLPNGLLIDSDTGSIFGMINPLEDSDMYSFTVTVRDQNDMIKNKQYSINTYHEFKLLSSPFMSLTIGDIFRKDILVNGGKRPYLFEIYSGKLPEGVILTESGFVDAIPEKMGSTCVAVQVTDDEGRTIKEKLIFEIVDEIQIKTDRLHHAVVDHAYNMKLEASGGTYRKYQWYIIASENIPRNMTLDNNSGVFSCVPKKKEQLPITVWVVDSCGHSAKKTFVFDSVEPLQIRSHTLGPGLTHSRFSEYISVTGGMKPYTFTLSDNLPSGFSFDPVYGKIDGIPIVAEKIQLNVSVKDSCYPNPQIDEEKIILIIDERFIFKTHSVLPDAYCNMPLSETGIDYYITVKGGLSPYTFDLVEGALPFGVKITKLFFGIELSSSPRRSGNFMFTIQATDATGDTTQKKFYWRIIPELSILTNSLSNAVLHEPYQEILLTEFGLPPYYWDIIKGTLPKGLNLRQENELWTIEGIPLEQPDDCEITFQVTDSSLISWKKEVTLCLKIIGNDEKRSFSMHQPYEISDEIFTDNQHNKSEPFLDKLFFLSPSFLKSIVIYTSYQKEIIVSGGKAPYTFTLLNGNLPSGITLMDNGRLEGISDKIGKASFVIKVTDTEGQTTEQNFSIEVVDRLSITNEKLPNALVGYFFKTRLNVSGGLKSQYLWDITSNILPKGMILDKFSGDFYGIPKKAEKCVINVRVRDSDGHHTEKNFLFHAVDQLKIKRPVLQTGHLGFDYNESIRVSGGVPPYTFQCPEYLPKNLTIDPSTGIIHGKALEPGRMDIKIMVEDSFFPISQHLEDIITITINEDFLVTTNNVLPSAIQNELLNNNGQYTIQLVGGTAPYAFTMIDGTLPTGVQLINTEKTVKLSQTPKKAGNFQFTLQVTDSNDEICQKEFFWHILEQMNISEQQSLYATLNESFNHNLEILGGISPFTCTIQSGNLPKGLALIKQNDFWGISGIPTELTRNAQISIIVKDSQSIPANIEINRSINVVENKLILLPESLPDAKIGKLYKVKIHALLGQPPYKWTFHENQLPDGLSCFFQDESIWIQGKPNAPGTFPLNIKLFDSNIYSEAISRSLSIVVHDEISILTEKLPRAVYGEFYSQTIEISNYNDAITCQLIEGSLPEGLELNSNTCTISGRIYKHSISQSFCVRASFQSGFNSYDDKCFSIISNIDDLMIITKFMRKNNQYNQYFHYLKSSGGIKPYHWFINKNFLPNGMNYYQENNILYFEGTPTQCGKFEFIVNVHDASQITKYDSKQYNLDILCLDPADIIPPTPPQVSMTFPGIDDWSNGIITVLLVPGEDNDSGIAGYSYEWNCEKISFVDNTIETSDLQITSPLLLNGENFYVHIASVDNAGNESETIHYGPFKVNYPGGYILIVGGGDRIDATTSLS